MRFFPLFLLLAAAASAFAQGTKADYDRSRALDRLTAGKVIRDKVAPHWLPGGDSFWYQNDLPRGQKEYVLVDATKGDRRVVAEPPKTPRPPGEELKPRPSEGDSSTETTIHFVNRSGQAAALFWIDTGGQRHSYGTLKDGEARDQHTFVGHVWWIEGNGGTPLALFEGGGPSDNEAVIEAPQPKPPVNLSPSKPEPRANREWRAFIRDNNVWIKHRDTGEEVQLSNDGIPSNAYHEPFHWSPDGTKFVANQTEPGQERKVYLVESSPSDQLQPKLQSYDYLKAGDRIDHPHPHLFDIASRRMIPVKDELFPNPWSIGEFHWAQDSKHFYFVYNQRGHQVLRLIGVEATTGEAKPVIEETSATFIDYSQKSYLHWLDATNEVIWMSERSGWNHLYLINVNTGVISPITSGPWNVRSVDNLDEQKRQVWVRIMGRNAGEDPYHFHLARVTLDGKNFTPLTEGDGTHKWEWSPDHRYFIDTWSRVDQPPVTELRDSSNGKLICPLEHADATALLATGWRTPERFVAKGRDGQTDICGVIFKPTNFDPAHKYPVIEQIYAGPHDFFVPKAWNRYTGQQAIAELGFIVVQIDGMGTNWRSKAFHDVCWKNLKDAGFPDRIAWLRAAAAARPWMDLSRVGIFGGSAGGQSALAALLFHGDFYRAAVADCGCHDNRMDKIWWNEAWMGWPVGPEYADNSNVTHAKNLKGNLLLVVGELDKNVDPSSTMQVVNALIKADKDFDLLVVPGSGHGALGSPYGHRRRDDFFVRHLLAVEPRAGG